MSAKNSTILDCAQMESAETMQQSCNLEQENENLIAGNRGKVGIGAISAQ